MLEIAGGILIAVFVIWMIPVIFAFLILIARPTAITILVLIAVYLLFLGIEFIYQQYKNDPRFFLTVLGSTLIATGIIIVYIFCKEEFQFLGWVIFRVATHAAVSIFGILLLVKSIPDILFDDIQYLTLIMAAAGAALLFIGLLGMMGASKILQKQLTELKKGQTLKVDSAKRTD
ncbi:hypothetical protein GWI72_02985 [Microvirga tunisiensis]|uniref:Uncharacterized protein n=1 Tax=Pannonibacter tanglangensis TaxID=2750084 RepID=A0A7X5F1S9_9HYPH|nr:hypothetical protein [Pannonibacter sp. XCT-53]NBN77230.1 hypothetical protein [Pannonibacter sp. XCT-53]